MRGVNAFATAEQAALEVARYFRDPEAYAAKLEALREARREERLEERRRQERLAAERREERERQRREQERLNNAPVAFDPVAAARASRLPFL